MKKILKILNNNVVIALDGSNNETVIFGTGIGFQKKKGDEIDQSNIQKIFQLNDQSDNHQFEKLLKQVPVEYFNISERVIEKADELNILLRESILFTLTDHIYNAVKRAREGLHSANGLLHEVKTIYPNEYEIGLYGVDLIEKEAGISLKEDEAAFIALHVIGSEISGDIDDIIQLTDMVREITKVAEEFYQVVFDDKSYDYYRFVTHLKFLCRRLMRDKKLSPMESLSGLLTRFNHADATKCAEQISSHIADKYQYVLGENEKLYLIIHILKITTGMGIGN